MSLSLTFWSRRVPVLQHRLGQRTDCDRAFTVRSRRMRTLLVLVVVVHLTHRRMSCDVTISIINEIDVIVGGRRVTLEMMSW
jgi:hypothetical protein